MKQPVTSQPNPPVQVPTSSVDTPTLELLANWRRQDETTDPEQLRAAENEIEQFKKAMDDNRVQPTPHP